MRLRDSTCKRTSRGQDTVPPPQATTICSMHSPGRSTPSLLAKPHRYHIHMRLQHSLYYSGQQRRHPPARLCAGGQGGVRRQVEGGVQLGGHRLGVGGGEVHLVDDRDKVQPLGGWWGIMLKNGGRGPCGRVRLLSSRRWGP